MLNTMRRGAKGLLAKLLIALLVFAFAIWGVADFVNQIDPTEVAQAGDTPVSATEFARVYRQVSTRTAQQMGTGLTPQQAQALGLPNQVLSTLITDALQVDAAHSLGVDLGDEALADRIRANPTFAGGDGRFSQLVFDSVIANAGYREPEFIELERQGAAQELLINALLGDVEAPTPYLEAFHRYLNQERVVAWFSLGEGALSAIPDPSDDTLRAYYEENTEAFRAPEYRALSVVSLSAEALADPESVGEAEVRRIYEASAAYGEPERRRVQQLVVDDLAIAEAAAAAVNEGGAFEDELANLDRTFADVDLGLVEESDLVDPAVAEAAFSVDAGRATAVDGRFGPLLVHVSEIVEGVRPPFEEVADEIRQEIALDEAREEVQGLYDSVEDAVAGGARVAEIAERFELPLTTVDAVSREGLAPDGTRPDVPAGAVGVAFSAAEGDDAEPVDTADGTSWVQLDGITPATDRPFDEVVSAVLVAWTDSERARQLQEKAAAALAALEAGRPLTEVAVEAGATANTSEPVSRSLAPPDLPDAAATAAFEGPQGHIASVEGNGGERIILQVTEVSEPVFFEEAADVAQLRRPLDEGLVTTWRAAFVNGYQAEVGATLNQPVIDQIIGLTDHTGRRL